MVGMGTAVVHDVLPCTTYASRNGKTGAAMLNQIGLRRAGFDDATIAAYEEHLKSGRKTAVSKLLSVFLDQFDKFRANQPRTRSVSPVLF